MDFVTTCKYIHPVPAACMAQFVEHLSGYKRFKKQNTKWVAVCVTFVHFLSKNIKGDNWREIIICACNDRGDLTHSSCYLWSMQKYCQLPTMNCLVLVLLYRNWLYWLISLHSFVRRSLSLDVNNHPLISWMFKLPYTGIIPKQKICN